MENKQDKLRFVSRHWALGEREEGGTKSAEVWPLHPQENTESFNYSSETIIQVSGVDFICRAA